MSYRKTRVGLLIDVDPTAAAREIKRHLDAAGGNVSVAAGALGVSRQTLYNWQAKLNQQQPEEGR